MLNKLEIIHIAPLVAPLGASAPGGAEHFAVELARIQKRQGLNVSIIALQGSTLPDRIKFIDLNIAQGELIPLPLGQQVNEDDLVLRRESEVRVFRKVQEYLDARARNVTHSIVVHNHCYDEYPMFELSALGLPIVHMLHLPPVFNWICRSLETKKASADNSQYVTVSKCMQRQYLSKTNFKPEFIYNGLDFSSYPIGIEPSGNFLFVSRISPEKGLRGAVEAVEKFGNSRLRVIGRVYDRAYFEREASVLLQKPWVDYLGPLEHAEVLAEMSRARVFLMPIEWDEPFGLVAVESLACGTPVIASRRGALPEILNHGETGFLVDNIEQMLWSMNEIDQIDRKVCAAEARERFDISKTAGCYLELYRKLCR